MSATLCLFVVYALRLFALVELFWCDLCWTKVVFAES